MFFFEEAEMKNINFSRGLKKTKKCSSYFKNDFKTMKITDQKIKCREKTFILKVFEKKIFLTETKQV